MALQVEHGTYAENVTGIIEGSVASRDIGEYFIALQVAIKKLVEENADFFGRPVWCCESDERHVCERL